MRRGLADPPQGGVVGSLTGNVLQELVEVGPLGDVHLDNAALDVDRDDVVGLTDGGLEAAVDESFVEVEDQSVLAGVPGADGAEELVGPPTPAPPRGDRGPQLARGLPHLGTPGHLDRVDEHPVLRSVLTSGDDVPAARRLVRISPPLVRGAFVKAAHHAGRLLGGLPGELGRPHAGGARQQVTAPRLFLGIWGGDVVPVVFDVSAGPRGCTAA